MTARGIGRLDHACQTGRHSQAARGPGPTTIDRISWERIDG
jgi:hypothetical protein